MSLPREKLVEFMKDVAGEHLRGVLAYDENGFDVAYVREDVMQSRAEDASLPEELPVIHDLALNEERLPAEVSAFGRYHATVRVFDDAVLIQLVSGEQQGYGISLDLAAARQLDRFVQRCTAFLEANGGRL
jgi:hypothetical protein